MIELYEQIRLQQQIYALRSIKNIDWSLSLERESERHLVRELQSSNQELNVFDNPNPSHVQYGTRILIWMWFSALAYMNQIPSLTGLSDSQQNGGIKFAQCLLKHEDCLSRIQKLIASHPLDITAEEINATWLLLVDAFLSKKCSTSPYTLDNDLLNRFINTLELGRGDLFDSISGYQSSAASFYGLRHLVSSIISNQNLSDVWHTTRTVRQKATHVYDQLVFSLDEVEFADNGFIIKLSLKFPAKHLKRFSTEQRTRCNWEFAGSVRDEKSNSYVICRQLTEGGTTSFQSYKYICKIWCLPDVATDSRSLGLEILSPSLMISKLEAGSEHWEALSAVVYPDFRLDANLHRN